MKTTIDLPVDVFRQLRRRALHDGRNLKDTTADILRTGLAVPPLPKMSPPPIIRKDKKTGLPVIQCRRAAPGRQPTPARIAQILIDQEAEWASESA